MKILMAASEAVPFAKTGGLADVSSGLSKALADLGHHVTLVLPCHRQFIPEKKRGERIGAVSVNLRGTEFVADLLETNLDGTKVRVVLIDQPEFFDRAALYTEQGQDYPDNAERFAFFSRAVLEFAEQDGAPDIVHSNDWQTGLLPALVTYARQTDGRFPTTGTVLTIHNMAFHGHFPASRMEVTGLPWSYFNWKQMEFYGGLNYLKTAISFADMVTTVSPTYSREICRPEFGHGLDSLLVSRHDSLVGILNGVDTTVWNPAVDRNIAQNYDVDSFEAGKQECKRALQQELGLPVREEPMLWGMISRLTDQKGLDLIIAKSHDILHADLQLVFLGTGDFWHEDALRYLQHQYPDKVSATIGFDGGLAHRIEAGADAYLMPSSFEPCGLNQMYSMIYGTVPLVHAVGGLADSVVHTTSDSLESHSATGYQIYAHDADQFLATFWDAVGMYQHFRADWERIVINGMTREFSWKVSATDYVNVYEQAIQHVTSH